MLLNVLYFQNCACECLVIPTIMLAKLVTYNSRNYGGKIGSGLPTMQVMQCKMQNQTVTKLPYLSILNQAHIHAGAQIYTG